MGVHGLWELLAPVGRRVSVETLAGKKLAIDASIWMIQFMKAMRDEKGEMVRNAHILGFFRRICKLLFLRTKPVFVFDGGTPALKRRTVIARRRQRENAQAKIRKTAEKLLLNHLKAMRLKELAEDLEKQRKENDVKGKRPVVDEENNVQQTEEGNDDVGIDYNQEELDAMLAASLAAEDNEGFGADASTSGAGGAPDDEVYVGGEDDDDDDDEDEEMILPEMHGNVDPAVLAALPPSMQLDLLVQMRERLMAENRQKYQKVKKAPERFSELQIQSYLKTVAFRREIDGVQKAAAGRGIGGMQTSRIASEANREFIFSSSFTGDKHAFTSVAQEEVQAGQSQPPPVSEVLPTKRSGGAARPAVAETEKEFHDDLETYLDERGRLRVSRVRALGIRMTRDLQRNLDLMKEIDQEKVENNQENNNESTIQHQNITNKSSNAMNDDVDKPETPAFVNGTPIEISFEDAMEDEVGNEDDKFFASLVAGDQETDFPAADISVSAKQSSLSASDCEWEEGVIEDKSTSNIFEEGVNDEREVEWEDGFQDESVKTVTKGDLQEEAEIQEAIRRSLEEGVIEDKSTSNMFEEAMNDGREVEWEEGFQDKSVKTVAKGDLQVEAGFHEAIRRSLDGTVSESEKEIVNEYADMLPVCEGKEGLDVGALATSVSQSHGSSGIPEMNCSVAKSAAPIELSSDTSNLESGKSNLDPDNSKTDPRDMLQKELDDNHSHDAGNSGKISAAVTELSPDKSNLGPDNSNTGLRDTSLEELDNDHSCYSELGNVSADAVTKNVDSAKELADEERYGHLLTEKEKILTNTDLMDDTKEQEMMKDYLEEEILYLGKEREELGSEQRKLERNAESVTSEMFAECQELLQMFGLPYIIAPMEAEAQCAFMELSNLVDGVVTDDSDAFLFGARSVYKNIFDDRKYVETYLMKDIEDELGLDREKLIRMALLLGSDYTEGISGIGIVNAIEVVNAFPEKNGLREFREWIESPDPTILGKIDGDSRKRGSKGGENEPDDVDQRIKQIFMDKHRNVSKNWHIPSTFPSDAVISAYDSPQVDKSTETFSWGKPDLFILRKLCWEKFGWNTSKTDELLVPVLKEYNKHETQLRLEAFYTFNERFAKIRSKRIQKALKGITGHKSSESLDGTTPQQIQSGKKRKVKPSQDEVNLSGVDSAVEISNENSNTEKPNDEQLRRGGVKRPKTSLRNVEKSTRNRGRGRGQVNGRGRKKMESPSADSDSDEEMELLGPEETSRVRRSARVRKTVNYKFSGEFDNCEEESENPLKEGPAANPPCLDRTGGGLNESDRNEVYEGMRPLMDTAIPGPIDINPIDPKLPNDDYLQLGGGFCVEDEEDDKQQASSPTRETIPDVSDDLYHAADIITQNPPNGGDLSDKELAMNLDDTEGIDPTNAAPKSLRAMPNLRRKRRKT